MKTIFGYRTFGIFSLLTSVFFFFSCEDLEVENLNSPDREIAFEDPADVKGVASNLYISWYNAIFWNFTGFQLDHAADQYTTGNRAADLFYFCKEPREVFNNRPDNSKKLAKLSWIDLYKTISLANEVLNSMENGIVLIEDSDSEEIHINEMTKVWCYFIKGLSLGYIGLMFDQGYIPNQDPDLAQPILHPWAEVIDSALVWLATASDIAEELSFSMPAGWISGYNLNQNEFRKLMNSYSACFLAYSPRTKAQTEVIEWNRVKEHALQGLDADFAPDCLDSYWNRDLWISSYKANYQRIDYRIINLLDPNYPARWPADDESWDTPDGKKPGPAQSDDSRLNSDFEYLPDLEQWSVDRGYYIQSHYNHKRYIGWIENWGYGPTPVFLKAENDLLLSEALLRTGDKPGALTILNDPLGSRIARGGLPLLPGETVNDEILEVIFYERDIELINTSAGTAFFDMRRRDMLQKGTILHFPIPGYEIEMHGMLYYSYGSENNADGINTSNGGWFEDE